MMERLFFFYFTVKLKFLQKCSATSLKTLQNFKLQKDFSFTVTDLCKSLWLQKAQDSSQWYGKGLAHVLQGSWFGIGTLPLMSEAPYLSK